MATARKRTTRKPTARKPAAKKKPAARKKPAAQAAARKRPAARTTARKAAARKPAAKKKPAARKKPASKAAARGRSATTGKKPAAKKAAAKKPAVKTRVVTRTVTVTAPPPPPPPPNSVHWFEIPVTNMDRAQAFYEGVLQVKLNRQLMGGANMAMFPMHSPQSAGATGTLMQSEGYTPSHAGSMVYFEVSDIDSTLGRAQARGGRVLNPKMSIGDYGSVAHFEDCEGNRIALHSMP